jgi:hypothetical protein
MLQFTVTTHPLILKIAKQRGTTAWRLTRAAWCFVVYSYLACLAVSVPATTSEAAGEELVPYLRVERSPAFVEIEDLGRTCRIGTSLPLLQKNQFFYIALFEDEMGETRICAFPRQTKGQQGTAWVTKEKKMIFGTTATSCAGKFYFGRKEELPVIGETNGTYLIEVCRYGRRFEMEVDKATPNLKLIHAPPKAAPESQSAEDTSSYRSRAVVRSRATQTSPKSSMPKLTDPIKVTRRRERRDQALISVNGKTEVSPFVNVTFLPPAEDEADATHVAEAVEPTPVPLYTPSYDEAYPGETPDLAQHTTDSTPAAGKVVPVDGGPDSSPTLTAVADQPVNEEVDAEMAPPTPQPVHTAPGESALRFINNNSLYFRLLLLVVLIQSLLLAVRRRKNKNRNEETGSAHAYETLGTSVASEFNQISGAEEDGVFSGSLDGLAMGELVQFLHSAMETGKLSVNDPSEPMRRELFFHEGEITDARYGHRDGEEAARSMLRHKSGTFSFKRQDTPARNSAIQQRTMSLLLNVHKDLDEENAAA